MKFVVLFTCLVAAAVYAAPQQESAAGDEPEIHIDDNGHFVLRFVDEDGAILEEEGLVLTDEETGEEIVIAKKSTYSYKDKDGKLARLAYDVDESADAEADAVNH